MPSARLPDSENGRNISRTLTNMSDYGDVPDEEKLEIVTGFLLDAPPGEFNEVVTDVRTLLNNDDLLNETFAATAQAYNTNHMVAVDLPDAEHKVRSPHTLLCARRSRV